MEHICWIVLNWIGYTENEHTYDGLSFLVLLLSAADSRQWTRHQQVVRMALPVKLSPAAAHFLLLLRLPLST